MPLEFNELKLGCNAKLSAVDLARSLSVSSIGKLSPNNSRMDSYNQTIDTIYSFGGPIDIFVEVALSHCANDLICNGILPEYSSYSLGIGKDLTNLEISTLFEEITKCHKKYGINVLNAHTFIAEHTNLTITLTGKHRDQRVDYDELILIQTKPLLGINAFAGRLSGATSTSLDTILTNHWSAVNLISEFAHLMTTDISGFGFLGHLAITADAFSLNIEINEKSVLVDTDGLKYFEKRGPSCSAQNNLSYFEQYLNILPSSERRNIYCFFEGETNGPIIIFSAANDVQIISKALEKLGYSCSIIGNAKKSDQPHLTMR